MSKQSIEQSAQESVENLNTNLPKVFIGNMSGHDFSDSARYGDPIYITKGELDRFAVGYMARRWMKKLLDSNKEDFILITSLTNLSCIGCAIFGWIHGRLNLLMFRNNKYISRTIVFDQLLQSEKEAHDE